MLNGASNVMVVDRHPDRLALAESIGAVAFDLGEFFHKGLRMGSGQCSVKLYNRYLRDLIHAGRATPSFIVSHHMTLDEAPSGYQRFDARENGWTKVVLRPGAQSGANFVRRRTDARNRRAACISGLQPDTEARMRMLFASAIAVFVAGACQAQEWSAKGHGEYARTTQTHQNACAAGLSFAL
jgi:hypothetical protein